MLVSQCILLPEPPSALRDGKDALSWDCYGFIFLSDPQVSYPIGAQYLSGSPSTIAQFGASAWTNRKLFNLGAAEGLAEAAACPCPWLHAKGEAPLQHTPGFFLLFLLKHLAPASFHWRLLLHLLLFLAQWPTRRAQAAVLNSFMVALLLQAAFTWDVKHLRDKFQHQRIECNRSGLVQCRCLFLSILTPMQF